MSADLMSRLWMLVQAYPALAFVFIAILCLLGTMQALALLSLSRPPLPLHQWEDDEAQARAVTRPAQLDSHIAAVDASAPWRRSGGNWRGEL